MIVLDSHIWYWWLMQAHHRLPAGVQRCIELLPLTDAMCVRATRLTCPCIGPK
jgi:PIN domain nuclease of toxin-antitoxin system